MFRFEAAQGLFWVRPRHVELRSEENERLLSRYPVTKLPRRTSWRTFDPRWIQRAAANLPWNRPQRRRRTDRPKTAFSDSERSQIWKFTKISRSKFMTLRT
ncbi:hypothetical protein AVEN_49449-1 [Araneus ventricosus]|uniref:Uncharacterized protein n=1 Tax=Araneus ventricosus TaxID=182803 RepID=A0A4Y2CQB7_ARAVE|nr:hypothetical protein AVEN_49449-1 [Araneus ventricosus]